MNLKNQAKEQAKKHGPTAGIATAAVIAVALMMPDESTTTAPTLPPEIQKAAKASGASPLRVKTRLVSCGDSTQATVEGDDSVGMVTLGKDAGARCTLLFARRWQDAPTCAIEGGAVVKATAAEVAVSATGETFTYRCGGG
jgi:hypothetical protein